MKSALLKFITIAAVSLAGMTAAQAQTANRPPTVPSGYVVTPFGYYHPSCVVQLAEGDELRPDQQLILHENGTTDKMPVCAYPHYSADGKYVFAVGDQPGVIPTTSGWVEAAYYGLGATLSVGSLIAQWTVPPAPLSNDGQVLFFWIGLENAAGSTVLQPVLVWNEPFPNAWGIQSWNVCCGTSYKGTPQPASPGDTIFGAVYESCSAGTLSCGTWNVVTTDLQNGKSSVLASTTSGGQTYNVAFPGVLEAYSIKQCTDFPNNNPAEVSFNEIVLYNDNFVQIANPNWLLEKPGSTWTSLCSSFGISLPAQVIVNY